MVLYIHVLYIHYICSLYMYSGTCTIYCMLVMSLCAVSTTYMYRSTIYSNVDFRLISDDFRRFQTDFRWFQMISDDFRRFRTFLNAVKLQHIYCCHIARYDFANAILNFSYCQYSEQLYEYTSILPVYESTSIRVGVYCSIRYLRAL